MTPEEFKLAAKLETIKKDKLLGYFNTTWEYYATYITNLLREHYNPETNSYHLSVDQLQEASLKWQECRTAFIDKYLEKAYGLEKVNYQKLMEDIQNSSEDAG